jgi:hypothetical protein
MRYHIYKSTRVYEGRGYEGYSSEGVLCEFDSIKEAVKMYYKLQDFNSGVGWIILDTKHNEELF